MGDPDRRQIIGYFRRDRPRDRHRGPKPTAFPRDWATWGSVRTTDELAETLRSSRGGYVHNIPLAAPLSTPPRDLPVDPYILGAWLGVLGDKHVPDDYLYGSETQRLALLQGLMDTDGYAGPGNTVEFSSTREQLANAVVWVAASLGQRSRLSKGVARLNGIPYRCCRCGVSRSTPRAPCTSSPTDACPTHNTCPGAIRKRQWASRVLPPLSVGCHR